MNDRATFLLWLAIIQQEMEDRRVPALERVCRNDDGYWREGRRWADGMLRWLTATGE